MDGEAISNLILSEKMLMNVDMRNQIKDLCDILNIIYVKHRQIGLQNDVD